jgi:hypothetical protein
MDDSLDASTTIQIAVDGLVAQENGDREFGVFVL